jgi:hypothetical protein
MLETQIVTKCPIDFVESGRIGISNLSIIVMLRIIAMMVRHGFAENCTPRYSVIYFWWQS